MLQSAPPHLRHFIVHLENTMWCTSTPKDRRSLHGCRRCLGKELLLPQKSTAVVNTLSKSKMAQRFQAFLFLSKLPTRYPFPRMSFCSTVLNIHLPLQTLKFIACCWTVMKLNRLSLSAWTKANKPTAGRTKAIHRRLELSFNLYLLLLFVGQNRASKSLLHITPRISRFLQFFNK